MSVTAAHLRELNALGIAGEALIRVVEIIDEASTLSVDKSADIRRGPLESTAETERKKRDKQRKRTVRAAEKVAWLSSNLSADKSGPSADKPLLDSVVLTSLLPSIPEKGLSSEVKKTRKRDTEGVRARGTRMMPGTPLSVEHRALIVTEGIHDPEKFWAEFVDYWSEIPGLRGVRVGWTGTLRNRCRDVIKRGFNGNGTYQNRTAGFAGSPKTGDDAIITGMGRALARRREARAAAEPGRQEFREERGDGGAGGTGAEPGTAPGDGEPYRQLALIPRGNG